MKCAYCESDITGTEYMEYGGLYFCNSIHRYSYKTAQQSASINQRAAPVVSNTSFITTKLWTIAGSGAGLLLGVYAGIHVLIPFVLMIAVIWILYKTNTVLMEARSIIALLSAQFGWMFIGALLTEQWNQVYIDLFFIGGGMMWLLIRFHAIPIITLVLFQIGVLILNINLILLKEIGTDDHRALTVHIVLRIMVLFALGYGLFAIRKRSAS
ncbi:MAG: hypothetical protein WCX28_05410 [Bacteriovoracaceae bacterium]|nr:hypothetical protein [Bacteroidota bacterium]